jgi:hypothetical protein
MQTHTVSSSLNLSEGDMRMLSLQLHDLKLRCRTMDEFIRNSLHFTIGCDEVHTFAVGLMVGRMLEQNEISLRSDSKVRDREEA